jgi:hypothetical protein
MFSFQLTTYADTYHTNFYIKFSNKTPFPIKVHYGGYDQYWHPGDISTMGTQVILPNKTLPSVPVSGYKTVLFSHDTSGFTHRLSIKAQVLFDNTIQWPLLITLHANNVSQHTYQKIRIDTYHSSGVLVASMISFPGLDEYTSLITFQLAPESFDPTKPTPTLTGVNLTPSWTNEDHPVYKLSVSSANMQWSSVPDAPPIAEKQSVVTYPYVIKGEVGNTDHWQTIGYLSQANPFTYDQSHHFSLKNKEEFYFRDTGIYTAIKVGQRTLGGQWVYSKPLALWHSLAYKGKNFGTDIPRYFDAQCGHVNPYNKIAIASSAVRLNVANNFDGQHNQPIESVETNGIDQSPFYAQVKLEDTNGNDIPYTANQSTYSCLYNDIYFVNGAGNLITGYYKSLAGDAFQVVTSEKGAYVENSKGLTNNYSDNTSSKEFYFSSTQNHSAIHACVGNAPDNDDYNNKYGHIDCSDDGSGNNELKIKAKNITPELFYIKLTSSYPTYTFQEGYLRDFSNLTDTGNEPIYQLKPNQYAPYYIPFYYHYTNADNQPATDKIWLLAGLKDYNVVTSYLKSSALLPVGVKNSSSDELENLGTKPQPFTWAFFKAITPTGDMISRYVNNGK